MTHPISFLNIPSLLERLPLSRYCQRQRRTPGIQAQTRIEIQMPMQTIRVQIRVKQQKLRALR